MIDIEKLEAGHELDALVVERVLLDQPDFTTIIRGQAVPAYSTAFAAATTVVEHLTKQGCPFLLSTVLQLDTDKTIWMASFNRGGVISDNIAFADTPALAICRAALKIVLHEGKD